MRLHRHVTLAVAAGVAVAVLTAPADAAAGSRSTGPASAATPSPGTDWPAPGYDVSHPQCAAPLPAAASFAIVGVNGGKVFGANPCLAKQIAWAYARGTVPAYYANTANPGPLLSSHWPSGQRYPEVCEPDYPANDSAACAYDYGWNAAADSYSNAYAAAQEAYGAGAAEPDGEWWLDVEAGNTWAALEYGPTLQTWANDVAVLRGAVDYLTTEARVRHVGFYSTALQWDAITGGTAAFAAHPVWLAGADSLATAISSCGPSYSFSGGAVTLVQYLQDGYDANYRCPG